MQFDWLEACAGLVCAKVNPSLTSVFQIILVIVGLFVSHEAFRTVSFTLQKLQSTVSLLIYVGRISILPLLTALSVWNAERSVSFTGAFRFSHNVLHSIVKFLSRYFLNFCCSFK